MLSSNSEQLGRCLLMLRVTLMAPDSGFHLRVVITKTPDVKYLFNFTLYPNGRLVLSEYCGYSLYLAQLDSFGNLNSMI